MTHEYRLIIRKKDEIIVNSHNIWTFTNWRSLENVLTDIAISFIVSPKTPLSLKYHKIDEFLETFKNHILFPEFEIELFKIRTFVDLYSQKKYITSFIPEMFSASGENKDYVFEIDAGSHISDEGMCARNRRGTAYTINEDTL